MRAKIFIAQRLLIAMLVCAMASGMLTAFAESEKVTQLEDGHYNIFMSNDYFAYDVQYGFPEGEAGQGFTVVPTNQLITKDMVNGVAGECSDLLKHVFVNYYDDLFENYIKTQYMVWHITSSVNNWRLTELAPKLKADIENGAVKQLPDHGASRKISENTIACFDFIGLISDKNPALDPNDSDQVNNLFGYKVRYEATGEIGEAITLNVPEMFSQIYAYRQWQVKGGNAYEDISGETGAAFTIPALDASHNGKEYRCVVDKDTGAYFDYKVIVTGVNEGGGYPGTVQPPAAPPTGDGANLALWMGLLAAAIACGLALSRKSKREY